MATCSKCGFDVDSQGPVPRRCPRCGTQMGVGAPPPFAAEDPHGEVPPGSTLFGVPDLDSEGLTEPLGDTGSPVGRRSGAAAGPPAIDLDLDVFAGDLSGADPATPHNELDLADLGPIPAHGDHGDVRHGELDLSDLDDDSLDLPAPRAPVSPGVRSPPRVGSPPTKAPAPIPPPPPNPSHRVDGPVRPAPTVTPPTYKPLPKGAAPPPLDFAAALNKPSLTDDLDLPTPVERDLPVPARAPRSPGPAARAGVPAAPDFGIVQPPAADSAPALDLDLDMPVPADVDLPMPADADVPRPANTNLPRPSAMEVRPTGLEVSPTGGLDVESSELGVEPATTDLRPTGELPVPAAGELAAKQPGAPKAGAAELDPLAARRSPVPKALPRRPVSRRLLYLGGGLVAVAAAGAAVIYSGVLDPDYGGAHDVRFEQPRAADGHEQDLATAERTPTFLAALHADTPQSYAKAIEEAQRARDPIAEAEAALLLHLRYGPDPVLAGKASALVKPHADRKEPAIRRVLGLDALSREKLDDAEALLAGDDPRTTLYRGWLRLTQERPQDALTEADAVVAEQPDDLAALTLRYMARFEREPEEALGLIEKSVSLHADHPGLREVAVRAALAGGFLAKARAHAQSLTDLVDREADEGAKTYRARAHALLAETLAVSGDHAAALSTYGRARELAPEDVSIRLARVRTMVDAKELSLAWAEIGTVVEAHPSSIEAALLQVEVSIASGKGEQALQSIAALETKLPNDARVAYLLGEAHALDLAIDEAKAAYASARARDPLEYRAAIGEARMLSQARLPVEGVAVLDAAHEELGEAPPDSARAARAVTALLLEKARLLESQGETGVALEALDDALQVEPRHNDGQLARGLLRLRTGEAERGRADLMAVYERTGGYPGLTGPLGRLMAADGDVDALEALVGQQLDEPELSIEVKLVGARLRLLQGRIDEARVLLEQTLAREPSNWEAHLLLAESLLEAGDAAAALVEIERVRPPDPVAELHLLRGQILEYNNRHDKARPEYLAALEIDPELHEARMWHGRLLALSGANKQAIEELRKVTDATGDAFPRAWLNLGRAQRGLGENEAALASLRRASRLDPTLFEASYLEGRLHADQNRHTQAIEAFEKAVVEDARDEWWYANALIDLGRAQAKAGQKKQALATFETFLSVAPPEHASRAEAKRQVESLR